MANNFAVVDRHGWGDTRSNKTTVASAHATEKAAVAAAKKNGKLSDGRNSLMVITGGRFTKRQEIFLDTIGRQYKVAW